MSDALASQPVDEIGPDRPLRAADVYAVASARDVQVRFDTQAREAMQRSHALLLAAIERGEPIYGVTTGFGPFVAYPANENGGHDHGEGLLNHLLVGHGTPAPVEVVRATMLIRARTLSLGFSGIHVQAAEQLLRLLTHDVHPWIPQVGSVGASGDLTPLAYIAQVLAGRGRVLGEQGESCEASQALGKAGLEPMPLDSRDALAMVNGTSFMSAFLALACMRMERLLAYAEQLTGWLYRLLGCSSQPLDARLHEARGYVGQCESARNIQQEAARFGNWRQPHRPLQEVYCIRCAPQVLGACRRQWRYALETVETEINGVNDNPLICPDEQGAAVLHGGNFQGQQIAFAADALNAAMTQAAVLVERQIALLADPQQTDGAPLLLAPRPGASSGLAGVQLTATALLADMRHAGTPTAFSSIPTNGGNQDIVSMGAAASRRAWEQTDRFAAVLAGMALFLSQLHAMREAGQIDGKSSAPPQAFPTFEPLLERDRPLCDDLQRFANFFLEV